MNSARREDFRTVLTFIIAPIFEENNLLDRLTLQIAHNCAPCQPLTGKGATQFGIGVSLLLLRLALLLNPVIDPNCAVRGERMDTFRTNFCLQHLHCTATQFGTVWNDLLYGRSVVLAYPAYCFSSNIGAKIKVSTVLKSSQ